MIDTFEAVDIMTGLAACQKYVPNLILLQLRLNTWDGFEVIRRLKDDPRTRSIPVIFLANSALTAEKAKGIDMGAVDFVSQPYDSVELLARVHSALRTKALLDLLEQRAHLDGLTELGNRFALQHMIPQAIKDCIGANVPLSLVIADLDHFKKVNDHYGHAAGDEILRRFAVILRHATRETDFLARYGGEEFVILCPSCDLATAIDTAERIRAGVADHPVSFRNSTIKVTASLGVLSTSDLAGEDPRALIDRADQALYRAKSAGRNVVWIWDVAQKAPAPVGDAPGVPTGIANPLIKSPPRPHDEPLTDPDPAPAPAPAVEIPLTLPHVRLQNPSTNDPAAAQVNSAPEPSAIQESLNRPGSKLGAARRELGTPRLGHSPHPTLEPHVQPDPSKVDVAPDPDTRSIPALRAASWRVGTATDTATLSASSSEIEALWGVENFLTTEGPRSSLPNPPEFPRASQSLFSPRVDPTAPSKFVPSPRRTGNGPPPPPPNPRLIADNRSSSTVPKSE